MNDNTPRTLLTRIIQYGVIIAALFPIIYGLIAWIDDRIESTVSKPEFLSMLAAQVRPSAIFNGKGSILADMGAMQQIDRISVEYSNTLTVVVYPKRHLSVAPIITSIDNPATLATAERGSGFSWIFTFKTGGYFEISDNEAIPVGGLSPEHRYRIELLQASGQ